MDFFAPVLTCLGLKARHSSGIYLKDDNTIHSNLPEKSGAYRRLNDCHPYQDEPSHVSYNQTDSGINEAAVSFVNTLLTSSPNHDIATLRQHLRREFSTTSLTRWTKLLAAAILNHLETALRAGAELSGSVKTALEKVINVASIVGFVKEHPVYCTILALGILVLVAPWVLEALGFAELGPIEGSWAALWQSRYAGYVPAGSLFSFFQRLGMVWVRL